MITETIVMNKGEFHCVGNAGERGSWMWGKTSQFFDAMPDDVVGLQGKAESKWRSKV